jgi:hypothetical protein
VVRQHIDLIIQLGAFIRMGGLPAVADQDETGVRIVSIANLVTRSKNRYSSNVCVKAMMPVLSATYNTTQRKCAATTWGLAIKAATLSTRIWRQRASARSSSRTHLKSPSALWHAGLSQNTASGRLAPPRTGHMVVAS